MCDIEKDLKIIFSNNLQYYMELNNINCTDLTRILKLPFSTVNDWIHAKSYPRIDKIQLLANYFNISKSKLIEQHEDRTYKIKNNYICKEDLNLNKVYAVTKQTLCDQDWKTQLAVKYPNIPANCVVEVVEDNFVNFYGQWAKVIWRNNSYYVDKKSLDFSEQAIKQAKEYYNKELSQYEKIFDR